jgi:Esterase/lipase
MSEPFTRPLWPEGQVPLARGKAPEDTPTITVYRPDGRGNGAAIVVCPGGGYGTLAAHEAEPVARWANAHGAVGVVLKYRLGSHQYRHPAMLTDAQRAIRTVRHHAREWDIDPARVGILGFSAGGHLASTAATHFDAGNPRSDDPVERQSSRPDVAILIYPVIDLAGRPAHAGSRANLLGPTPDPALVASLSNHTQVTRETPPTYLVHSSDDKAVPIENSLRFALALEAAGVPFAMQVYERGGHGYGMGKTEFPETMAWPDQCARWLKVRGFLK